VTASHPVASPTPAMLGSVLDGDPRVLIPLPEVAERLGISRWQAYKLARSGRLPTTRLGARDLHVPAAVLRRIEQEGLPQRQRGVGSREPPLRARHLPPSPWYQELNELLLQLPKPRFAALVEVALARPVLPAGLVLRFEPAVGVDGWRVVACAPRRQLGTLTRDQDPGGRRAWRAWTRAGDPVQVAGACWWRRRLDAGTALAWVTPVSGARCLAVAAHVRALPDRQLHELLAGLPRDRYDRLLEAAFAPEGTAA
jgi:hypothetical protein